MSRENEINSRLADIDAEMSRLRKEQSTLLEEAAVLVTDLDRAEMKRRGWVTHTWRVTERWASASVCPFCLTACASHRQGKDYPNEQNAEYHCGNRDAIGVKP